MKYNYNKIIHKLCKWGIIQSFQPIINKLCKWGIIPSFLPSIKVLSVGGKIRNEKALYEDLDSSNLYTAYINKLC